MRISGHKHVSLARLLDDPIIEFPTCTRCGNEIPVKREAEECSDCEGAAKYHPRGVQGKSLPPYNAAYEVSLHYAKHPIQDRTIATLEALNITYVVYTAKRDSIEVDWAKKLFNPEMPIEYPIVLISAHGKALDYWAGFDLAKLNAIPAARDAAIHTTAPEPSEPCVPITERKAA